MDWLTRNGLLSAACVALLGGCSSEKDEGSTIGGFGSGDDTDGGAEAGRNGSDLFGGNGFGASEDGGGVTGNGSESCASTDQDAVQTPTQVLFLVDRSGSMNCNSPDGDAALAVACVQNPTRANPAEPSKWEITRDALLDALGSLAGQSNVSAGLTVFPKRDGQLKCQVATTPDVDIDVLTPGHRDAIEAHLRSAEVDPPLGDTPIAGTMLLGYEHLRQRLVSGAFSGNSFVILLTDGAETCAPEEFDRLVASQVALASEFDIKTFVIGAPGSEAARSTLSLIARDGQTAASDTCEAGGADPGVGDCHFDMTESTDFAEELSDVLAEISRDKSLSCEFDVPESTGRGAVDLDKVNVTYTPTGGDAIEVGQLEDLACLAGDDGWIYSEDRTKIILCGALCEQVQADPSGDVIIELGCETRVIR